MKTKNMQIDSFIDYIKNRDVYIYGIGDFYQRLTRKAVYPAIHKRVAGYIDNGKKGQNIDVLGCRYTVWGIDSLKLVSTGIILLCGTNYLDEMYTQLCKQHLSDKFECFIMPFIWMISDGRDDPEIIKRLHMGECPDFEMGLEKKIEKKIHCFWFSDEKKPEKYQRCIDSWSYVCPGYEIIEWNADSYDCSKNKFVRQAFEKEKWAFVSDYARLDVIYNYGGIYLDMDVELLKDFEPLLQFDAFFNYGMRHMIELGSGFGSVRHSPFIGELLRLYEGAVFLDEEGQPQIDKFVQPVWINGCFRKEGFWLNGNMQIIKNMVLLPRRFYTPKDDIFLYNCLQCDETRGIHHFNSEWRPQEYLEQRQEKSSWVVIAEKWRNKDDDE